MDWLIWQVVFLVVYVGFAIGYFPNFCAEFSSCCISWATLWLHMKTTLTTSLYYFILGDNILHTRLPCDHTSTLMNVDFSSNLLSKILCSRWRAKKKVIQWMQLLHRLWRHDWWLLNLHQVPHQPVPLHSGRVRIWIAILILESLFLLIAESCSFDYPKMCQVNELLTQVLLIRQVQLWFKTIQHPYFVKINSSTKAKHEREHNIEK